MTTDVRRFRFTGETADFACDGTAGNAGRSATPVPTRGAALAEAAERAPLPLRGTFSASLGSPSFTEVAGENVDYDPGTQRYLGEYKNGRFSSFGSRGDPVQTDDDVLFAYGTGSEQLLSLSGPVAGRSAGWSTSPRASASLAAAPRAGCTSRPRTRPASPT